MALKLKPEIKSYSRFKGAEKYANYSEINSKVKKIIHNTKTIEFKAIN